MKDAFRIILYALLSVALAVVSSGCATTPSAYRQNRDGDFVNHIASGGQGAANPASALIARSAG